MHLYLNFAAQGAGLRRRVSCAAAATSDSDAEAPAAGSDSAADDSFNRQETDLLLQATPRALLKLGSGMVKQAHCKYVRACDRFASGMARMQ
jgi:hypothetical protein